MNTDVLYTTAVHAALEAGKAIMRVYHETDHGIVQKEDRSPLTKADLAAHEIINQYLQPTGIPVLSEEGRNIPFTERAEWQRLWMVDPIDGTKEFIQRNGEFTVNIALIENHQPIVGIIFAPVLNMLYVGGIHIGAYRITTDNHTIDWSDILTKGERLPLQRQHGTYRVVASRSHLSAETEEFINTIDTDHREVEMISKGSSLKLCLIAEGTADCYPRVAPTMEWDTAAGHGICNGAGKKVIQFNEEVELQYNKQDLLNPWFVAR
jgi:3'(2'), 5'-bisphosphate nucleotidase